MLTLIFGVSIPSMESVESLTDTEVLSMAEMLFHSLYTDHEDISASGMRRTIVKRMFDHPSKYALMTDVEFPSGCGQRREAVPILRMLKDIDLESLGIDLGIGNPSLVHFIPKELMDGGGVLKSRLRSYPEGESMSSQGNVCVSDMSAIIDGLLNTRNYHIDTYHPVFGGFSVRWLFCVLNGDGWKERLAEVANGVGLCLKLSHHTLIGIFWYADCFNTFNYGRGRTKLMCHKQTPLTMLDQLLKRGYTGSRTDEAVIVTAYLTGKVITVPAVNVDLIKRHPFGVFLLFIVMLSEGYISPYCVRESSAVDTFCLNITSFDHLATAMKEIGMVPGQGVEPFSYFLRSISDYSHLFERSGSKTNLIPLQQCTDKEILSVSEPDNHEYTDRYSLIVGSLMSGRVGWSFRKNKPGNLSAINVLGETYLEEFKGRRDEMILSYGDRLKYRCWSVSCLLEFVGLEMTIDNVPMKGFFVPDYLPPSRRGKDYPNDTLSDSVMFTEEQISELLDLLEALDTSLKIGTVALLIYKLTGELMVFREKSKLVISWLVAFRKMDVTRKTLMTWYIRWFITLSIWVRKWKGPGHPYPHDWVADGNRGDDLCEPSTRDANVIQHMIPYAILRNMLFNTTNKPFVDMQSFRTIVHVPHEVEHAFENLFLRATSPTEEFHNFQQNMILVDLIESLHVVNFNFKTGAYTANICNKSHIDTLLKSFLDGKECAGQIGDVLTSSGIFLAWKILGESLDDIPKVQQQYIISAYCDRATSGNTPPYIFTEAKLSGHVLREFKMDDVVQLPDSKTKKYCADQVAIYYGKPNYWLS